MLFVIFMSLSLYMMLASNTTFTVMRYVKPHGFFYGIPSMLLIALLLSSKAFFCPEIGYIGCTLKVSRDKRYETKVG